MSKKSQERMQKLRARQRDQAKRRNEGQGGGIFDLSVVEGDVVFFKMKAKSYSLDFIPYEVTSENHPQSFQKGDPDYKLDIWIHKNIGINNEQVICLKQTFGKPCPICEDMDQLTSSGIDIKDDRVISLKPTRRCYYNVLDLDDQEKGFQILDQSHFLFEKEIFDEAESKNPEFSCFADLEEGYTVEFRGAEETFKGRTFVKPKSFGFVKREPYDESILEEVYPLDAMLKIPTYEEIQMLYLGMEKQEEDESTRTRTRSRKIITKKYVQQQEPEPEPEPCDENDPPTCPCFDLLIGRDHKESERCKECDESVFEFCAELNSQLKMIEEKAKPKSRQRRTPEKEESKTPARRTRNFKNRNR